MRRPSAYAPLSVTFATGRTGTAIQNKHGLEGLAVWAAMIATAKRGRGQIVFAHDADWQAIGLFTAPSFTIKEFLRTCGNMKQTRTKTHGHVMYVQLTRYADWNDDATRERERERKSSKTQESIRKETGNDPEENRKSFALEPEPEEELEQDQNQHAETNQTQPPTNNGLDFTTQLELTKLLAWIGDHQDDRTAATIRKQWQQAPEAARRAVERSITTANPKHRAKWLVAAIISETTRARTAA